MGNNHGNNQGIKSRQDFAQDREKFWEKYRVKT